jgi:ferrochelatase
VRTAVVLFNLGGPDGPEAVEPFLFNLFNDPAIIRLPGLFRRALAWLIARRRAPVARKIYAQLGGGSPLLANTEAQARALEAALAGLGEVRAFIVMRYWHPRAEATAAAVKAWSPDRVVLLPLYPQYSTTTTASSLADWGKAAGKTGLAGPTHALCCYPDQTGFVAATAAAVRRAIAEVTAGSKPRVLFSAHGLPKKVVAGGDPYQWQVERTAAAVVAAIGDPELDWTVCYQSRVGPLEWIGPSTDAEIGRAGADRVPVVIAPIAFVSEHSETLVEIEVEYRHLASERGVPEFIRVPAVAIDQDFITGLADLVRGALDRPPGLCQAAGTRICPAGLQGCPV